MAGHNKWSKIKHRKAAVEKKKTKLWSKISRAIMVAARNGGGDPASNLSLRYAIDEARYANMPRDTIERAIKKGTGEGDTSSFETIRYEGYGPGGSALIIDALTDNRTRTINDVRLAFTDAGGNVGASGCVAYMFHARGTIVITSTAPGAPLTEDRAMELGLDAGAIDVRPLGTDEDDRPVFLVLTSVEGFESAKKSLEAAGVSIREARLSMEPETRVTLSGESAETFNALVDALEDLDDVQNVYTNADTAGDPSGESDA
ncbi:MAG: YebC/PmpR family DNA-binding transcriptional regulator [Planctomycetota bacterium]|nr:YebC/PmpR family DNA-binding transcriptional regulator [Planctomycetota bacterium]